MLNAIYSLLGQSGLSPEQIEALTPAIESALILVLAVLAYYFAKKILVNLLRAIAKRTTTEWDDKLVEHRLFFWIAHLAPAIVIYLLAPAALAGMDATIAWLVLIVQLYMIVVGVLAIDALLNACLAIYNAYPISHSVPLKSFFQVAKILLFLIAMVLVIAMLLGKSPVYLLGGMGIFASVLMLVFKDPILGLVGGIQLAANRMLAKGDWIEMPSHNADGDVIDIALTTVKVQNWDKTITTIPTYALISESFKNWRGMSEAGGRRIKRAVHIDTSSIRRCTPEMLERFAKIRYISAYIEQKRRELTEWNQQHGIDMSDPVNARQMTNVGTFRAYVLAWLREHPRINQDMTLLVRQLEPGPNGLPIQIYCFTNDTRWAVYESIQADIFDHILAIAPEFDLRISQHPTGSDLRSLIRREPAESGN